MQRRKTILILRVVIGAPGHQQFDHAFAVRKRSVVQRRTARLILRVEIGAVGYEPLNLVDITGRCIVVKRFRRGRRRRVLLGVPGPDRLGAGLHPRRLGASSGLTQ